MPVRKAAGRDAKLTPDQKQQSAAFLERGLDMTTDGVVHRCRINRQARIKESFEVEMHGCTVGKHLAELGFVRLSMRPQPPKANDKT